MKSVGIVVKRGKPEAAELARRLVERHPQLTFVTEAATARELGMQAADPSRPFGDGLSLLIALGGDGTLIHAARLLRGAPVPILGINLGRLGFLTEVNVEGLDAAFERALTGELTVDTRMKLAVRLIRNGETLVEDEVLNDVVLNKGALARIADHALLVDGEQVTTYKADGVIVSTPTGSTAYSLSAGGPIVHPELDCILVSPICSHALTQRPLVIAPTRRVGILLTSEVADVYLTIDGQVGHALEQGDLIEIRRSSRRVHLVRNPGLTWFGVLRQKMYWGQ